MTKKNNNAAKSQKGLNCEQQKLVENSLNIAIIMGKKWAPLGRKKGLTTDDLIQEACLGLCKAAAEFKGKSAAEFRKHAEDCCRYMVQRAIRQEETANKDIDVYKDETQAISMPAEDEETTERMLAVHEEKFMRIDRMIAVLNGKERKVIRMLYGIECEVKDFKQVAQTLGMKSACVHQIYEKAMTKLEFSNIHNYGNN
jgi:RNA polymerase sigma factor (sigma-70 family)